jgi:EPS-associated MarR family transcriptional regulator
MNQKTLPNTQESEALDVLRHIEFHSSQKSLAAEIGCSVGKVNYILKALVQKGFVKYESFSNSTNKKKYAYLLTKQGLEEKLQLTEKFIARKKKEYEELQLELEIMKKDSFNAKMHSSTKQTTKKLEN